MRLDYDVIGEDIAARHIFDMGQRARDPRPAMRKIRDYVLRPGLAKNFSSQGSYFGESWPPMAPSTKGGELGVRTGALKASLMGGKGRKISATKTQAVYGTKVWYAHFFHSGTKTQPARPIVGATEGQINAAIFVLRRYVTSGIA